MILARMMQAAEIAAKDRCLDVAGGGGYAAALLARLSAESIALEDDEALAEQARTGFAAAGLTNARAATGALSDARVVEGSFEAILLEAAVEAAPTGLLARLTDGGRLVAIRSESGDLARGVAQATLWTRSGDRFGRTPLFNAWAPVLPEFAKPPSFVFRS
jgi:protein-L-isoaspartate(D-aspartate) O-methyltransferase